MKKAMTTLSTLVCYEGDNSERKLRKFFKSIERNINNIIEYEQPSTSEERQCKGFQISIESVNGIKKIFGKGRAFVEERKYFIRYFMNMLSLSNLHFYGNTYRSPLLPIVMNETGEIFFENPETFYAYCLSPEEINDVCIVQVIYVETTKDNDIINQSCEGWSILPIVSKLNPAQSINLETSVYLGTPRELIYKEIKSIVAIQGASLVYSINSFPELETIKYLLPDYIIIADKEEIPGLLQRYIPKDPKEAREMKTVVFDDVYFKNIEIEFNPSLEDKLIAFASQYRLDKYSVNENQFNKIFIKERRLKCGIHNTWCFINSNGLENSITLLKKDNTLYYRGVHLVDHFFSDEMASCAFIIELNYVITVPITENQKEETLSLPVGYSVFVPDRVTMENNSRSAYFITGPGVTVYGDHLWDPLDLSDKIIKVNFILSKNKETVDRTNKEKNLKELNSQMEAMKTSIINEYNQTLLSKDQENDLQVQELEERIKMLQTQIDLANREAEERSNYQPEKQEPIFAIEKIEATEALPQKEEQQQPIQTEKIETKQKEPRKENARYEPKVSQTSLYNKEEYNEFQQFLDYKKKAKMYKSSEQLEKDIEDTKITNKIIYEESTKDISRKEKAGLISKGILGLDLNETTQKSVIEFTFEKELTSSLLAHVITFQFLTYKPRRDVKRTNEFPNKIRFNFSFWDFENFNTSVCTISKNTSVLYENLPMTLVKEGSAITSREEEKDMSVTIKYDPSANSATDLKSFITYLLNKQMLVMITDAETLLEFGYIKVPLRDLIRQGKSQTYQTKEYDIINQDFELKGSIQMMLKSVEGNTMKPFHYDPVAFKVVNSRMGYNVPKKKKVAVKPIDLNKLQVEDKEKLGSVIMSQSYMNEQYMKESMGSQYKTMKLDIDIEKKVRVMRYLKEKGDLSPQAQLEESKLAEMNAKKFNEDKFFQQYSNIERLKQLKKESILSKVSVDNHRNTLSISLVQGQPHFLNYVVYNESEQEELFHIVISSSYEKEIPIPQEDKTISIVSTPEEWRKLVDIHKLAKPNDFNCLSSDYYLSIKPNESVPLVIKLLSYEQKNLPSSYTLWIHRKNGHPIYYFVVNIPKIFPLIDHVFQYNVPCNQFQKIRLVNPFKFNTGKTLTILNTLICTDISVHLQAEPKSYDFLFQYSTKEEGYVHEFMLFLYLEPTRSVLYATWKFEIYCKEIINVNANIGGKQTQHIPLTSVTNARTLQLFSERPETLFFPEEFNSPFVIVPSIRKEGVVIIYPKKEDHKEILVNCVDISTRELVKSWLFKLATFKPTIDQTMTIECKVGSITNLKYEFKNPMNSYRIFNFDSNNDDIMNVVDTRVQFNASETNYINLSIPSQSAVGRAEAMMFIYDNDELYSQNVLFQINYK